MEMKTAKEKVIAMYNDYYEDWRDCCCDENTRDAARSAISSMMVLEEVLKNVFGMTTEEFEKFEDEVCVNYNKKNWEM